MISGVPLAGPVSLGTLGSLSHTSTLQHTGALPQVNGGDRLYRYSTEFSDPVFPPKVLVVTHLKCSSPTKFFSFVLCIFNRLFSGRSEQWIRAVCRLHERLHSSSAGERSRDDCDKYPAQFKIIFRAYWGRSPIFGCLW